MSISPVSIEGHAAAPRTRRFLAVLLLAAAVSVTPLLFAQTAQQAAPPHIDSADPTMGKVDETVTLMGQNLGKSSVAAVFLSDDKTDYKADVMDQEDAKIIFKVPKVKAGGYNVSVQVNNTIYLEPVRFTVQD